MRAMILKEFRQMRRDRRTVALMVGLPLVRNGLVVIIIVNFVTAWGEYLLCSTLTNDQSARTVPVMLAHAAGRFD